MRAIAIVGSRRDAWKDPEKVAEFVDDYLDGFDGYELVISGESPGGGVDSWVKETCLRKGIPYQGYPADWRRFGRAAGPMRNQEVVLAVVAVTAIWDGVSPGTYDVIKKALKAKRHLEVQFPEHPL